MKRLYVLVVISVVGAGVLSMVLNLFIMRAYFGREGDPALRHLRPDIGGTLDPVAQALEKRPDLLLEDLAGVMDVPVEPMKLEEMEAIERGGTLVTVPLASGSNILLDTSSREAMKRFAYVPLADGTIARVGPLEADDFWSADRFGMWLAVMVVVAMVASFVVVIPITRGLNRLEKTALQLSAGDFSARALVRGGATRELSKAFNSMAKRIEGLLENNRDLLQAVSHELRTPIARIRFSLEMLEAAATDAARAKRVAAIDRDLTELDELVSELVTFSRVAADVEERDAHPLSVRAALTELVEDVRERRRDVAVDLTVPEGPAADAEVLVEARSFRRAMRNLALNAMRHGKTQVVLSWATAADGRVAIFVDDDGEGVQEPDRERIFEPFTRADASRSRDSGGIGLGLAIVRRIIEVHGGRIDVREAPLGGARFTAEWPLVAPAVRREPT
ncbi:MAG: HAMP domain-containing protein [Deltaproteobacteria bacterium]|nr:MAG: HAMP domain-containing protein [Deltaproteobacteria bacterium]